MTARRVWFAGVLLLAACEDAADLDPAPGSGVPPPEESPARALDAAILGAVSVTVSSDAQADGESYFFEAATAAETFQSGAARCFSGYAASVLVDEVPVQAEGPAGTVDLSARFGSGNLARSGDVVTVSAAASARVPAFVGYVRVPKPIRVTAPPWLVDESEPARLPAGDLTVTWSYDGDDDDVTVVVSSQGAAAGSRVQCVVPARAGTLTVEAIHLAGVRRRSNVVVSVVSSRSRGVAVLGQLIGLEAAARGKLRFFDDAP